MARFQSQLSDARNRQAAVGSTLSCLASRSSALLAYRDANQIRLGELRQLEQVLLVDVAREQATCDGYREALQHEERNLEKLQLELRDLEAKRTTQDQELRDCKSRSYIPNFMCDFAKSIAHLTGAFEDVSEQIRTAERKVNHALDGVNQSLLHIEIAQKNLKKAVSDSELLDSEVRRTERDIGATQHELSVLRDQAYAHQILLDDFTDSIAQSVHIDTDDVQMRTARQLRDASQRFDASASRLAAAVAHASKVLPNKSAVCIQR